jgi:Tfp pilus assembly protein PilE
MGREADPLGAAAHTVEVVQPDGGFDALEIGAIVVIISVCCVVALRSYSEALTKVATTEVFGITQAIRRDVHEHYERTGRWPTAADLPDRKLGVRDAGSFVELIELGPAGEVTVTYNRRNPEIAGRRLTMRPILGRDGRFAPPRWACGTRTDFHGVASGTDRTDVPERFLHQLCRNGAPR